MDSQNHAPRFSLGRTVATPGALDVMRDAGISPFMLLRRHQCGDWGELDAEDRAANDRAVAGCLRILSAYRVGEKGETLWVISEWDRSVTTILTPGEY
ncbi:hypothetical protein [Burkholderia territorii]|uniref:hypothetical protein n=1 Tax=Burkholderia territorii TaxID=1503055 RepID=UPI000756AAA4|nr:hypothetical protein [Burkholderia territorii]KVQ55928.1 hypothetical protein WT23_30870 [Burkholderia territorii]